MKTQLYKHGAIGRAARCSLFLASPAMLNTLGCRMVGHELCETCGRPLEVWKTANSRYMPLVRTNGMEWNAQDRIMYQLHWHASDKETSQLDIKREREAWQATRQAYKNHLRLAAGVWKKDVKDAGFEK